MSCNPDRVSRSWYSRSSYGALAATFLLTASCAERASFIAPLVAGNDPDARRVRLANIRDISSKKSRGKTCGLSLRCRRHSLWFAATQDTDRTLSKIQEPSFAYRKLGSFEKTLTQTRDGLGPEQDGHRVMFIPHVWAAVVEGNLSRTAVLRGVESVLARHPMLRACIRAPEGPHEPLINIIGEKRDDSVPLYFCESDRLSLSNFAEQIVAPREEILETTEEFARAWRSRFESNLNDARLPVSRGPNWRLEILRLANGNTTSLICTINHALEDQRSSNIMLRDILAAASGEADIYTLEDSLDFPPSVEAALLEGDLFRGETFKFVFDKAIASFLRPRLLPEALPPVNGTQARTNENSGPYGVNVRKTCCEVSSLPGHEVAEMLQACRARGATLSGALSAACLMSCSDVLTSDGSGKGSNRYKFLLAVDMRRFGAGEFAKTNDWTGGTVASAGGATDYVVDVGTKSGTKLCGANGPIERDNALEKFWSLAIRCKDAIRDLVERQTARESVAFLEWAMDNMNIWESLNVESRNPKTLGRAYTCGVSNMGRYPFETEVGDLMLKEVHFGNSISAYGSLIQLSCGTVNDTLYLTVLYTEPLISRSMAQTYMQRIKDCLRAGCNVKVGAAEEQHAR